MATITKRGSRWEAQIRRKGYPSQTKSFLLKSDAQEWARYMEQQMDLKSLPSIDPKLLDGMTLTPDLVWASCLIKCITKQIKGTYERATAELREPLKRKLN